tara:strand:- start:216 stop:965 length:750 start_codon:yes stop_codon:yes gene_type:complete
MKILVLSMDTEKGRDRRSILNYPFTWVKSVDASNEIRDKFKFLPNTGDELRKIFPNGFASHLNMLQYIVKNKLNKVIVNEDDAILEGDLSVLKDVKEITLLGGTLRHPTSWAKDKEWREAFPVKLKRGVNVIDYDKFRWAQIYSVYYPTYKHAEQLHRAVSNSTGYKLYDLFLSDKRLINHFYYPSLFTHIDIIDKDRNFTRGVSQINKPQGIIKNYRLLGKDKATFLKHNPFKQDKSRPYSDDSHEVS